MPIFSKLLKRFRTSKTKKVDTEPVPNIWNHKLPSISAQFDIKLEKNECRQKQISEEKESRKEKRTLRRQNRFLGFHNDLLTLQNQQLASEKKSLKAEKLEITEKKNSMARKLRKQKRISEYYRRRLVEMQKAGKCEAI